MAKSINVWWTSGFKVRRYTKFLEFHPILPIARATFYYSTSHYTSCGQNKHMETASYANRGYFNFKSGNRNQFWPREGLQLAKIRENACSSLWCCHDTKHDLRSPISLWNWWIACQMKALTYPHKKRIRITGFKYLIGKNFSVQVHPCSKSAQLTEPKYWYLARHPELNLNPLIMADSLNESSFQVLQYISLHFHLSLSRSSSNKGWKAQSVVLICTLMSHARSSLERKLA